MSDNRIYEYFSFDIIRGRYGLTHTGHPPPPELDRRIVKRTFNKDSSGIAYAFLNNSGLLPKRLDTERVEYMQCMLSKRPKRDLRWVTVNALSATNFPWFPIIGVKSVWLPYPTFSNGEEVKQFAVAIEYRPLKWEDHIRNVLGKEADDG